MILQLYYGHDNFTLVVLIQYVCQLPTVLSCTNPGLSAQYQNASNDSGVWVGLVLVMCACDYCAVQD